MRATDIYPARRESLGREEIGINMSYRSTFVASLIDFIAEIAALACQRGGDKKIRVEFALSPPVK